MQSQKDLKIRNNMTSNFGKSFSTTIGINEPIPYPMDAGINFLPLLTKINMLKETILSHGPLLQ